MMNNKEKILASFTDSPSPSLILTCANNCVQKKIKVEGEPGTELHLLEAILTVVCQGFNYWAAFEAGPITGGRTWNRHITCMRLFMRDHPNSRH